MKRDFYRLHLNETIMRTIKILAVSALVFAAQFSFAQNKSDKMYDTFSNKDGVTNFSFTKNMTDAFNIDLGEDNEGKELSGDLNKIRFMSYNPKKGDLSGTEFIKKAEALLPSQYKKYEGDNRDDDADIYLLENNRKFKEFLIFIKNHGEDQMRFVVSFYGDFTVNDIEGLTETGHGFSDED